MLFLGIRWSTLPRLLSRATRARQKPVAGPIRGELLGAENLAERARVVAGNQRIVPGSTQSRQTHLLTRLDGTQQILSDIHERLLAATDAPVETGSSGEWLMDNFHVVEEHIREVRENLPRGFYHELPVLDEGRLAGYPRVYELAITLISHTEGRIDLENLSLFVDAFQEITPLTIGELWALPAMLRLGLIENVRRMALRTVEHMDKEIEANQWIRRIHAESENGAMGATLNRLLTIPLSISTVFTSRYLQKLQLAQEDPAFRRSLEQWMVEKGVNADDAEARATQRQALTQVMMAHSITSLRTVARVDWRTFVEAQSVMEAVLKEDPSADYPRMTFATRDRYRHVVERIARRTDRQEEDVARTAVDLARAADETMDSTARAHVGYYLIDDGIDALERATGYRSPVGEAVQRWILQHPNAVYFGGLIASTAALIAAIVWFIGPGTWGWAVLIGLLIFIPVTEVAVSLVNQLVTTLLTPRTLPRLDFHTDGEIPSAFRTTVVIPILFDDVADVEKALENLEVQYLANRETNLHFAILSDFTDAPTETCVGDAAIVEAARAGVRDLNSRYAAGAEDAFFLFHRARQWNAQEGVWMGWERKRGKLVEFNRFLRGGRGAFSTVVGDVARLQHVRFVITLDADTVLPPDAAPLLVGTLAHPLNRPVYNEASGRVVRGYGILQPRVGVSLPSAHRSRFAAIHSGHPGVDPYTTAVSDVYQDLFGEGSFTGKGIYDVDAFEQATYGRFAENTLLSHDLIEGSYVRTGLATDVIVYDDYPPSYLTFSRRKHRWIRGDWQLLRWLAPTVPGPDGPEPNRLPFLSRWKILDNLRRSTVEIALLVLLLAGWTVLPGSPLLWTVLVISLIAAPWAFTLICALVRPPLDKSWRAYYAAVGRDTATSAKQAAICVAFLGHQALISADAIFRTLWRVVVSRRYLLEWQTASVTEQVTSSSRIDVWRTMRPVTVLATGILIVAAGLELSAYGGAFAPADGSSSPLWQRLLAVVPLVGLWLASPAIARTLNHPLRVPEKQLSSSGQQSALRYALLHWRFFDRFVSAETQWLAPDNFQEDPEPTIAMRTSPTNIGLQLLSTTTAYDLGFVTLDEMTERLEQAFDSLERLERFRGHFFNWYDLNRLDVLEPKYISTVDSGNLAGHLIALRQACLTIPDDPLMNGRAKSALAAALALADERLIGSSKEAVQQVRQAREVLAASAKVELDDIAAPVARALHLVRQAGHGDGSPVSEWLAWVLRRIEAARKEEERPPATSDAGPSTLRQLADSSTAASTLVSRLESLAHKAYLYAMEMDFGFLFDDDRRLFVIGYNVSSHAFDGAYYDLLASEARLTSFLAVAKNDVPVEHWFSLGRSLTHKFGETSLVSWSGSMFEYLMPSLVMRSFPVTLLSQTYRGAVRRQMAYAEDAGTPWGISESAYNLRDRHLTYQYRAFGVPDLALKRGLGRELVIAPYASALAMMVDPKRALSNLERLEAMGSLGRYGFYDALDFTRPDPDQRYAVVRNYMAHHIGMGLVAMANVLNGQLWQSRFHGDPLVRAAELLLYERIPRRLVLRPPQSIRAGEGLPDPDPEQPVVREITTSQTAEPRVALLGRLPYTIMVTNGGGGYSRYENLAVTRWRADGTTDETGQFCYLKDLSTGRVWSSAEQPVGTPADAFRALFGTDRVSFERLDGGIETHTEITVVPEDSAEVRRVKVTNCGETPRDVVLMSYGELILAAPEDERSHPAFSNLFVETEWHEWCTAITASRRPRSADEPVLWCAHVVDTNKHHVEPITCETDRAQFIGRGRSVRDPVALDGEEPLSGTTGAVLDPIFALRVRVHLEPGQSASVAFTTLVATTRERAFELADRYHDCHAAQRAFDLARVSTQVELRELGITSGEAAVFQELAGCLFFPSPSLRAPKEERDRNRGSQPLLWSLGLSGDIPILVAVIKSSDGLPTLDELLSAHRYWRRRGMMVDLVILNANDPSYLRTLNESIVSMLYASHASDQIDQAGGVFIRRLDELDADALLMLRTTAPVLVQCDGQSLKDILEVELSASPQSTPDASCAPAVPAIAPSASASENGVGDRPDEHQEELNSSPAPTAPAFDNGFGTIQPDGTYEIRVRGDRVPPAPWANVVANEAGGFMVTERGAGSTWVGSSYFFRLTPWHNDPVTDPPGEVLYIRDEQTGAFWSATPAPVRRDAGYTVRHGAGFTSFRHETAEITTDLTLAMAPEDAVKISVLRLTNESSRLRRISVTGYVEWTLGVLREHTQHQVRAIARTDLSAIFARNTFDPHFAEHVAFCALTEPLSDFTTDRRAFIGRNGTRADPRGMRATTLGGANGSGVDPCAAVQCMVELSPGESREIVFLLGAAKGDAAAEQLLTTYRDRTSALAAVSRSREEWAHRLSAITVRTPEPSFDVMLNQWALYQALACRMWARSAVYQSGGAYGFRDQLQDVMAFLYAEPEIAREHILRAAARQFVEGDVQHWWHPHSGRGVRTRFSDDLVWLPYVVDQYVRVTGDRSILDVHVPFIAMRSLEPHEHEVYDLPLVTDEHASIYEHCRRALDRACTVGAHGLPLIGIGDWNDGMNRVGVEGRGESVWLAWFLVTTLRTFAEHAEDKGDTDVAVDYRARAEAYVSAIDEHGWDGAWYRRAYFDDGTPLGSAAAEECRIDAIAQSWSVISGAGDPARSAQAMRSFEKHLVRDDVRLLPLLTPPFDRTSLDPGYIKGYVPGVRENGAQYTHAALWSVLATALQGRGDRAFELFQMINPLMRTRTPEDVSIYKVEPYVVAADVYTAEGHVGRGGWTWYTGSASWMYRVGLEAILGFRKEEDVLYIDPAVPADWPEYTIDYRHGTSSYAITVLEPAEIDPDTADVRIDGVLVEGKGIPLVDDGEPHRVVVQPGGLSPS